MSAQQVLLVSEEKLKSYTNLNTNISPSELQPYLYDAQEIYLVNYLGATYLKALKERVFDGTVTASDEYLLDNYIPGYLCNTAFYLASTFLNYRAYNKGILKNNSENAETMELDELKFFQAQLRNISEGYAGQLVLYLQQHPTDFPEYLSWSLKDGQGPDKSQPYTSGMVIPNWPYASKKKIFKNLRNGNRWDSCEGSYNLP